MVRQDLEVGTLVRGRVLRVPVVEGQVRPWTRRDHTQSSMKSFEQSQRQEAMSCKARNNKDGTLPYLIPLPSKEILYEQTGSSLPAQTKDGMQRAVKLQVSHPDDSVDQQSVVFCLEHPPCYSRCHDRYHSVTDMDTTIDVSFAGSVVMRRPRCWGRALGRPLAWQVTPLQATRQKR